LTPGSQSLGSPTPDPRLPTGLSEFVEPPLRDIDGRVGVGMVRVSTSDTHEHGTQRPVVWMDVMAHGAFQTGIAWGHVHQQAAVLRALVAQLHDDQTPTLIQDGAVRPAFWRTFRPGASTVPLAERVILGTTSASTATMPWFFGQGPLKS
jgi:hypothetical protein